MGSPFAVERGKRAISLFQPNTHCSERGWCEVEIPGGGEIRDPGLVGEVVVERAIGCVGPHMLPQAQGDPAQPCRIGEARRPDEGGNVRRLLAMEAFGLLEQPVHRMVGVPAVIGRVEVGGDVLDVPAQMQCHEWRRPLGDLGQVELAALAEDLSGGHPKPGKTDKPRRCFRKVANNLII